MEPTIKTPLGLLCEMINRDNPDLKTPITPDAVAIKNTPTAVSVNTTGRNTRIYLVGKPGKGFSGTKDFLYDRLALSSLFNNIRPVVKVPGGKYTLQQLLPFIREQIGLVLDDNDFQPTALATSYSVVANEIGVVVNPNYSACYTGGLTVYCSASPIAWYPDSGPGSKGLLFGDEQAGYFGDVPATELFTANELMKQLWSANQPSIETANPVWGKFFWKGRILYIALQSLGNAQWMSVYNTGSVYGDGSFGVVLDSVTPVQQMTLASRVYNGKSVFFRVRLPRIAKADKTGSPAITESEADSEMQQLFKKIHPVMWGGSGEWYDTTTNRSAAYMLTLNSFLEDSFYPGQFNGKLGGYYAKTGNAAYAYMPVLELLDPSKDLVPLGDIQTAITIIPPVVPVDQYSSYIAQLQWGDFSVDRGPSAIVPVVTTVELIQPITWAETVPTLYNKDTVIPIGTSVQKIESISWASSVPTMLDVLPVVPVKSGMGDLIGKINLSQANGELDGF